MLLLLFLPLLVSAVKECPRFGIIQEDIPCIQPSSWKPDDNCNNYDITLFNSTGDLVYNTTWYDYTPYCAFNITGLDKPDTYCYNSSIEDGCITLSREDNMLSIILVQIALVVFFIVVGLPYKFGFLKFLSWAMAALEILITVWMIYIVELGNDISQLLYINALSVLVLGGLLGFIAIFMLMAKMSTGEGKKLADDGYTKFVFDTK